MKDQELITELESTIKEVSDWIRKEIKNTSGGTAKSIVPEMIVSLSKLVELRETIVDGCCLR